MITRTINIIIRNGTAPTKMSSSLAVSPSVAFIVNTTIPNGGVIMPISIETMATIPNHIRFISRAFTTGITIGMVTSKIDAESKKQPRTTHIKIKHHIITIGEADKLTTNWLISAGRLLTANILEYIDALISRRKTLALVWPVYNKADHKLLGVIRPLNKESMNAPNAPIAPASVGVNTPL